MYRSILDDINLAIMTRNWGENTRKLNSDWTVQKKRRIGDNEGVMIGIAVSVKLAVLK